MNKKFELQNFLPFRLNRLANDMSTRLSNVYQEKYAIDVAEWRVVATLACDGESTAQAIVESTRTHKSTISRAITRLIKLGWVTRNVSMHDGRRKALNLTPIGNQRVEEILPLIMGYEDGVLNALGESRESCMRTIRLLEKALKE